jgi:hypothetical protein
MGVEGTYFKVRKAAQDVSDALRAHGYPVSDGAKPTLFMTGNLEARALHEAAATLRDVLAATWDGQ